MNLQTPSLLDAALVTTKAFPAADANNTSTALAIGTYDGTTASAQYAMHDSLELQVTLPADLGLVEDKTLTLTPMSSTDNAETDAFARIPQLSAVVITGKAGNGMPATEGSGWELDASGNVVVSWPLPRKLKKYVAVNVALLAAGGTLTASSYTVSVIGYK